MTTREDVLLQMGEVRYKKGDGTLYVMNERLAWIADNRDTVAVSHRFTDIKMQKISPEGKPKVQLQVVLHDGNSSTFHFVNRNGQQAMLADRDKVKELLQQLLPNFKRKVDKELEEKGRILSNNPHLFQLYKDLVVPQVISSEEFWSTHAKEHTLKESNEEQEIGVSGAFLADIKPQTDGCNGLKYNLSTDIIQCIFKTYPAVKRKHQENVPNKLTEAEFWKKFFQSHYFHRDRLPGGNKDLFSECGKIDDLVFKTEVQAGPGDALLDIKEFDDLTLEDGFGGVNNVTSVSKSGNIVHQNMIKRFNQHSMMVLKTFTDVKSQNVATNMANTIGLSNCGIEEQSNKKNRILEKIFFEDLGDPNTDIETTSNRQTIDITNSERYFQGPATAANLDAQNDIFRLEAVQLQLVQLTGIWQQRTSAEKIVDPAAAVNALGELSPGGDLMRGFQEENVGHLVPVEFENDLRNLYISLLELLKHFWACFPISSTELEEKARQMYEAIQRFKEAKLEPFENRAKCELSPLGATLTQHLNNLVLSAQAKYVTWQERIIRPFRM